MEKRNLRLTCKDIRGIDLVDFLASLGHHPVKVRSQNYWYLSPLRVEKTASFKVNRIINCWFDFQLWQGGDLIDFATLYQNCTIGDLLKTMNPEIAPWIGSKPLICTNVNSSSLSIQVLKTDSISDPQLLNYLHQRRIPARIAILHCKQATVSIHDRTFFAIAFRNDLGGYELRNSWFKGSSSPKAPTTLSSGSGQSAVVFEGFFDFLSYLVILPDPHPEQDIIILNGLGMIPKIRHQALDLFLDRDAAGREATLALCESSEGVHDRSDLYSNHKDLNDFICHSGNSVADSGRSSSED